MLYEGGKLLLLAGPSLLENEKMAMQVAESLVKLGAKHKDHLKVVFKSSFDKANRSSLYSARGNGMDEGLKIFAAIKDKLNLPTITDVHERYQIEPSSVVCDAIQIPSALCRQTDLLVDAARSGVPVNVRKSPKLSPQEFLMVAEKLEASHAAEILLTERGSAFGYGDLVVDMRSFTVLKKSDCPILFDATHTAYWSDMETQRFSSERTFALPMAKAAMAAGADGLYIDVHPEPENALVDGATQLPLSRLESFVDGAVEMWTRLPR